MCLKINLHPFFTQKMPKCEKCIYIIVISPNKEKKLLECLIIPCKKKKSIDLHPYQVDCGREGTMEGFSCWWTMSYMCTKQGGVKERVILALPWLYSQCVAVVRELKQPQPQPIHPGKNRFQLFTWP